MTKEKTLDTKISKDLAESIFRIRKAVAIKGLEDFLLLSQVHRGEPPYFTEGGVLRLSPKGVFIYGVSNNKRDYGGATASYTYTSSQFSESLPEDDDGVKLAHRNPAENSYGEDRSIQVLENGTLVIPENHWPGKLLTDFIERYTPSALIGHWGPKYDPEGGGFPGCDSWPKLDEARKHEIVEKLINSTERAFLLKTPDIHKRVRFKE